MNRRGLALAVVATTLILFVGVSLLPNGGRPSDDLLAEILPPLVLAGAFSMLAGFVASRGTGHVRSGAIGGGLNALANLGLLLLLLTVADRHFRSIGGLGLVTELPLVVPIGALLGTAGAHLWRLRGAPPGRAAIGRREVSS